jgi:hypothetical protein
VASIDVKHLFASFISGEFELRVTFKVVFFAYSQIPLKYMYDEKKYLLKNI